VGKQKVTRKGRLPHKQQMQEHKERKAGCAESLDRGLGIIAVIARKSKALG
jgi:exoribonuclease II